MESLRARIPSHGRFLGLRGRHESSSALEAWRKRQKYYFPWFTKSFGRSHKRDLTEVGRKAQTWAR
jgi:hypothetical protein